jgi:L-asparaginase
MKIRIIVTGGTFDKEYNELNGELFFKHTHIKDMLKLGRCKLDFAVQELFMKDSLLMTDEDREKILIAVNYAKENRIVITHGTDKMVETAQVLAQVGTRKTIILTGAMIPYSFGSSDGMFNLGSALAFAQSLPSGVYVVMNGKCFHWHNVRKKTESGYFEELDNK